MTDLAAVRCIASDPIEDTESSYHPAVLPVTEKVASPPIRLRILKADDADWPGTGAIGCIASDPIEDTERITDIKDIYDRDPVASPPIRLRILKEAGS